jgi:2'-5' RNA ligase
MIRTFIGVKVDVAEDLKNAVALLKHDLRNESIKWVDFNNLHVTLGFIGSTEDLVVKQVIHMLKDKFTGFGNIEFSIAGLGVFKSFKDPKIIFSGIENREKLVSAYETTKEGLNELDIKLEERQFNPHLTIGRIKALENKKNFQELIQGYSGKEFQQVTITEVVYYESVLLPTGPIYKPISKVLLKTHLR